LPTKEDSPQLLGLGSGTLKYRPDIDGLRAVAVLSVMAYHLGLGIAKGGYIGVDVFFVISGYLISSIVFREIAASRFSVFGFYERRIRRILPALFGMLVIYGGFATQYLFPGELVNVAKSLLAATVSLSNFYFWVHSGYFDSALSQPLIHTWSLAVEEQFYILFPLVLVVVGRYFPAKLRLAVSILFIVSLLASVVVVSENANTAFYMPYTRAWELLLGTIVSLGLFSRLQSIWLRNLAALVGLGMVAASALLYTDDTLFPGLTALVPCLGTALIIGAGGAGTSLVGAMLSGRPVVFVGSISYSLYLWHWPVIVSQKMGLLVGMSSITSRLSANLISWAKFGALRMERHIIQLVELSLSFGLAVLSWWLVERPFRSGRLRLTGRPLFVSAGLAMIALIGLSSLTIANRGFENRFSAEARRVADGSRDNVKQTIREGSCFLGAQDFEMYLPEACLHRDEGKKNYLLVGDSHSAMLWPGLHVALQDVNFLQASRAQCPPVVSSSGSPQCAKTMDFIFQSYLPSHPVDRLLLVARWGQKNISELTATISWAKEHQIPVTLFGPMPEYDAPLRRLLAFSIAFERPQMARRHLVASNKLLDERMRDMAATTWQVPYVSLYREICPAEECIEYADASRGIPLMDDGDHLNSYGAILVIRQLVEKGELK